MRVRHALHSNFRRHCLAARILNVASPGCQRILPAQPRFSVHSGTFRTSLGRCNPKHVAAESSFCLPWPARARLERGWFRAISPAFEQPVLASDRRSQQRLECANLLALLLAARANLQRVGLRSRKTAATSRRIPNAGATAKQPRCPDARSMRGAKPGTSEI